MQRKVYYLSVCSGQGGGINMQHTVKVLVFYLSVCRGQGGGINMQCRSAGSAKRQPLL